MRPSVPSRTRMVFIGICEGLIFDIKNRKTISYLGALCVFTRQGKDDIMIVNRIQTIGSANSELV